MTNFNLVPKFVNTNNTVSNNITKYFYLFLKRHKVFLKYIPLIDKITHGRHFPIGSLFNGIHNAYNLAKNGSTETDAFSLELSQRWRIFLLENFDVIFEGLNHAEQTTVSDDIITRMKANRSRLPMATNNAIKKFIESHGL